MTPTTIALAQLASYLFAVLVWFTFDMANLVKAGWEDDQGFHYGEQP